MRDFSKSEKSPVIDRICEICGSELEIKKISSLSGLDFIYTKKSALSSLGRLTDFEYKSLKPELIGADVASLFEIAETDIESSALSLSEESVNSIYPGDIGLSQSRLDRYNSCPLSYFCSYNLGLDSGERAKFDAKNIGSFIHSVLENFFREIRERGLDIKTLTKEERDTMARRHARAYVMSISDGSTFNNSARLEAMLQRLTKSSMALIDGLCDEFSDCDYIPAYFELDIGKSKTEISPSAIRYTTEGGRNIYVAGIIDRVDTYKSGDDVYVRVVDYKTGQKEFKPSDIDEGENLQMFLYLKAICDTKNEKFRNDIGVLKDGRLIPAGVIYVKTDLSDITIPKPSEELAYSAFLKNQTRKGMLLDDKTSIDAMNKAYIPIRYTKSGEPDSRTKDNLYTEEGWEGLSKKVEHSVLSIFSKMESGDISPAPKKKGKQIPCEYCPYKPICRKESLIKQ
jgi:ATP-dependent helicase/nuclease subunit B